MKNSLDKIKSSNLNFERTVVLVKPDGVQRGLIGNVISRFEDKGLKLIGLKMITVNDTLVESHYAHHIDKPFFKGLSEFMKSSPIVAMAWEGVGAIDAVRLLCGSTTGRTADAGTIRGDLGIMTTSNIVHASDSQKAAKEELVRFFDEHELHDYDKTEYLHIYLHEV